MPGSRTVLGSCFSNTSPRTGSVPGSCILGPLPSRHARCCPSASDAHNLTIDVRTVLLLLLLIVRWEVSLFIRGVG
jgi:hypothetical protein